MNEFIKWIQCYLKDGFDADEEITKNVTIELAHKQGNTVTTTNTPQIQIQILDNAEVERYSVFDGETTASIPLQINAYTSQMKISNKTISAQESSIIFGQKIKVLLNKLRQSIVNENVLRCRIITMSPALPLLNGEKVYFTSIRCEFWVANPYK